MRMKKVSRFISAALVLLLVLSVSSLPLSQTHHLHNVRRRAHPASKPPLLKKDHPHFEDKLLTLEEELAILEEQPPVFQDKFPIFDEKSLMFDEEFSILQEKTPFEESSEGLREELSHHGVTKMIIDEEDEQGHLHIKEVILEENTETNPFQIDSDSEEPSFSDKDILEKNPEATGERHPPKKFNHPKKGRRKPHHGGQHHSKPDHSDVTTTPSPEIVTKTSPQFHKFTGGKNPPLMLPVTTEGKTTLDDPLKVYGFPKELLPIMPGGGSRFEDVEREKLEKKKMSQTKGGDDDSAENGGSHEAESLYSSASLSSFSIAIYCLVWFLHLGRLSL